MSNNSILVPSTDSLKSSARELIPQIRDWIVSHWSDILIASAIAAGVIVALLVARAWALRLCRRGDGSANWYAILGRAVSKTGNFFIVAAALRLVQGYSSAPPAIAVTVYFLFAIAAAFQVAIWIRELIFGVIENRTLGREDGEYAYASALGIIRLLVSIVVFAIAFVVVLSNLGVNVTGLVAGLGVGGIAIGLAAQGIFADLFAALAILFDKPFRVGDMIAYDSTMGTVQAIGLKSTRLLALDGDVRIISNRNLLDKEIRNIAERDHIRVQFTVGVAYETPADTLDRIPTMLREIVADETLTVIRATFVGFGASTLDYEIVMDVPGADWDATNALRDRIAVGIIRRFREAEISFAYPTQTTFTAAPDGKLILPYPQVQPVMRVDKGKAED